MSKNCVDIKRIQNKLLEMGIIIKNILEQNNIPYMITFGTLLGAVRHEGFIPWDDDFDFFLFDDTYDEAIELLRKELPKNLFLEDDKSEPLYFHGWAHVKDLNSEVICDEFPQDSFYKHHGLSVDLYKCTKILESDLKKFRTEEHIAYLDRKLKHGFISKENYDEIVSELKLKLNETPVLFSNKEIFGMNLPEEKMYIEDVFPLKKYKFEDCVFFGPNNADKILTQFLGKYDYLKQQGVDVVYFPYGAGVSSSNLKKKIYESYEKIREKTDNHFPLNADTGSGN